MVPDTALAEDPLDPLFLEAGMRLITGEGKWPITWLVGDAWVVDYGCGEWTIGPDEPATTGQVRELMISAGGVFELQDL